MIKFEAMINLISRSKHALGISNKLLDCAKNY